MLRETFARCADSTHIQPGRFGGRTRRSWSRLPTTRSFRSWRSPTDGSSATHPEPTEVRSGRRRPHKLESLSYASSSSVQARPGSQQQYDAASEGLHRSASSTLAGAAASACKLVDPELAVGFAKGISRSRLAQQAYEQALVFGAQFPVRAPDHQHRLDPSDRLAATDLHDGRGLAGKRAHPGDGRGVPSPRRFLAGGILHGPACSTAVP